MESPLPHGAKIKPWGWSLDLGCDRDRMEEFGHRILSRRALAFIKRGGFSSVHYHGEQSNAFYVFGGKLIVREFERDGSVPVILGETTLYAGDEMLIRAGQLHQFLAVDATRLLEVYVAKPGCDAMAEDIHRFSENGCDEELVAKYV